MMNEIKAGDSKSIDKMVIGIVETRATAEQIVAELHRSGFGPNEISVIFPDNKESKGFALENSTKAPEGAVAGAGAGGIVGGTLGVLVGIGALAIPGLGPFIAAGPLLAGLSGIAAGATVGGFVGALVGMGIPEIEAKAYEGRLRAGNMLIAAHARTVELEKVAKEIFKRGKAHDVSTTTPAKAHDPKRVS
jgi:hypothetical protein